VDETTPSRGRRTKPDSLSDRLRLAINRLTGPELQDSTRGTGVALVTTTTGDSEVTASVTEFAAAPTRQQVSEEI
jgi:hypothetical protein